MSNVSNKLEKLSGSNIFCFFPDVDGRRVLILGEMHGNDGLCDNDDEDVYNVEDWLYDLAEDTPNDECLDLFVEQEFTSVSTPLQVGVDGPLNRIRRKFEDCYTPYEKEDCPKNLRYHYIDIRKIHQKERTLYSGIYSLYLLLDYRLEETEKKYKDKKRDIINYLLGIDKNNTIYEKYINDLIDEAEKYFGEEQKRRFEEQKRTFKEYMKSYLSKIDKELNKLSVDKTKFLKTLRDIYLKRSYILEDIISLQLDVYFLSRLFMKFDIVKTKITDGQVIIKPSSTPSGCKETVKNAIFYGGLAHSLVIIDFIKTFFKVKPLVQLQSFSKVAKQSSEGGQGFSKVWNSWTNKCIIFNKPFDFFSYPKKKKNESHISYIERLKGIEISLASYSKKKKKKKKKKEESSSLWDDYDD